MKTSIYHLRNRLFDATLIRCDPVRSVELWRKWTMWLAMSMPFSV